MNKTIHRILSIIPIIVWACLIIVALFSNQGEPHNDSVYDGMNSIMIKGFIITCAIGLIHSVLSALQLEKLPSGKDFTNRLLRMLSISLVIVTNISFYYCIFIMFWGTYDIVQNNPFFSSQISFYVIGAAWICSEIAGVITKAYRNTHCLDN